MKIKYRVTFERDKDQTNVVVDMLDPETGEERTEREMEREAANRAARKIHGERAFWFPDPRIANYGQLFKGPTEAMRKKGNTASSSISGMQCVRVEKIGSEHD